MSTTHCTYVMMETISYYNANGSNVYAIMFDASKAFNRINYCKRVLLKRITPGIKIAAVYVY